MSTLDWWRTGTIYQVYIRSFADSNGDGTGDINGLRSKLPYLADLGIDGIWINPWYPSPLLDGGYDVADYRDIHPSYGTLEDADAMIEEAHEFGIRILVDLVPNHCSWDHVWFKAALQAAPGSPERARFHFTEGSVADDGTVGPPNNWKSVFGGSAWTQVDDGQWYLHLFDPSQPTSTGPTPRFARSSVRSCVSGLTAAPTVSVSMSLTVSPRTWTSPISPTMSRS